MPDDAHVELIRVKLTEKYGSMWQAANSMSFSAMSGAQLLTALRSLPMHPGMAKSIEDAIGINPNSFAKEMA